MTLHQRGKKREGSASDRERTKTERRRDQLTELEIGSDLLSPEENLVVSVGNLGSIAEVEPFVGVGDGEVVV